jgi:hypothetical protein
MTGGPDPTSLGEGEAGTTGVLTANICTSSYLSFDLAQNDPLVINNNIALTPIPTPPLPPFSSCQSPYSEVYAGLNGRSRYLGSDE